jgi:pimeloyl-ACP methyl ester carboxylesterase
MLALVKMGYCAATWAPDHEAGALFEWRGQIMNAARLGSALRAALAHPWAHAGSSAVDRMLEQRAVPLATAIAADRREIATSDAGSISYYVDDSAGGRPLVLLHGVHAAASSYEMRPLFESKRGKRSVYALDLPGFGYSGRSARVYKPATYVHAIEHLLRNVATSQGADVIALSLTCEYAAKVAVEMPDLVRSLVLISPTGFAAPDDVRPFERKARQKRRELAASLAELPACKLLYQLLVTKPSLRYLLRRSFEERVEDGLLAYSYATSHQLGAHRAPLAFIAGELFSSGDPRKLYGRVRAPSLVLYDQDPYTSFGGLESFAAAHPNFALQRISHTRGLPQFDAPQQTSEALRSFYERLDAQDSTALHHTRFIGSA